jgi:hypothetical protein
MTRRFRGATYEIAIHKPAGLQKGLVAVELDGRLLPGNVVPPATDGGTHKVKVTLRAPATRPAEISA